MLIVEDGTGVVGADSFASVVEADAYHVAYGNAAWANLTLEAKEVLLRTATRHIRINYFSGFTVWPLALYADRLKALKQATAELAFIARGGALMPTVTRGKKKIKIGPLEVEYDATAPSGERFPIVAGLLAPLFVAIVSTTTFSSINRKIARC